MIAVALALAVTVEPAFVECRPKFGAGSVIVEAENDAGAEDRRVHVELADNLGRVAAVELDLPARSHKRLVLLPPLVGNVRATLVDEAGTRTQLVYGTRDECQGVAIAALARDDGRTGVTLPADVMGTNVEPGTITREDLAGSWRPLLGLDAIAAEARAIHELSDAEFAVLFEFVRAGGVLVIVPGIDPAPLFESGRLPAELTGGSAWQSARAGAGMIVVNRDSSWADPRLASVLAVAVSARASWNTSLGRILEAQHDRAGPAGRTSRPAGVLSLGICLLTAAAAHELLRRKFVAGDPDFPRYFQGLCIVLGVSAVSGVFAAFVGSDTTRSSDLVLAHSSGPGSSSRAILVGARRTRELVAGAWPSSAEREMRYVIGARIAVSNESATARVVLERTTIDLGGTLGFDAQRGSMQNDTPLDFEAGWIVDSGGCYAVPPLRRGRAIVHQGSRPCPMLPDVQLVLAATQGGLGWYVARSGEKLFAIALEDP